MGECQRGGTETAPCMQQIAVGEVLAAAKEMLGT